MFEKPELVEWLEKQGDRFAGSECNLIVETVELDGMTVVNLAGGLQREVEIQQGWLRRGTGLGNFALLRRRRN
jgi:hypothetical protein